MSITLATAPTSQSQVPLCSLLGTDDRVIKTVTTDREGVAVVPASYDVSTSKYILADIQPFLVTGVRWTLGRREYNLPLQVEPLVNRLTVKSR
jgi:hypothetical protein